ncbi:MAG TPA: response regulator [Chloroflexia bacterium]|nr:response regulator [Chloroflexia bacterium]
MTIQKSQPARILLIDDSQDNLNLLRELLEREGYNVTTAQDGTQGLEHIYSLKPDLVLSDVMMPGLNGFQLTQRIRSDNNLGFIPIILITARNDPNDRIRALEAGADDFLVKPIQRLELVARARSLIRLKQSTQALIRAAEDNARLYVEAENRATEFSTLNETALAVNAQLTLAELLNLIARKSCELVRAEASVVYLCNDETGSMNIYAEYNTRKSYLGRSLTYGEGVAGLVAVTGKPMRINNYSEWSGRAESFANDTDITAVLSVPLIANGRVIGVIDVLDDVSKRTFSDEDVRLLNLLAPQAATAVANAMLYDEVMGERDRIEAVLNSVKDGILMLDRNFRVILANPRFTELMTLEVNEVLSHTMGEVADRLGETFESDPPFSSYSINRVLDGLSSNPDNGFQRRITITDPKRRYVDWSIIPVRDQYSNILGWLNVFHDTTQQRELEQLRDDFISMLVHDLRSPLTSIIGGIELVSNMMPDAKDETTERQAEFLEQVQRNCYNLLNMVNALLEVSRLEAGRMPLTLENVLLEELLDNSVATVAITAKERQVTIIMELPDDNPLVNVDVEKMKRVIVNLLSNAIHFSPPGSTIHIKAQVEEGVRRRGTTSALDPNRLRRTSTSYLRDPQQLNIIPEQNLKALLLTVSDEGPGIPPGSLERIFDKFIQLPSVSRNRSGTGLGLALCKLVVEAHGGRIWAESELGKGSSFNISMPCVVDKPATNQLVR